jgi:hypothetical protein
MAAALHIARPVLLLSAAGLAWAGLAQDPGPAPDRPWGRIARTHIEALSGQIGSRAAGSAGEQAAAAYIEAAFREAGYAPAVRSFSLRGNGRSANVVAVKPGRSSREILLGAHYDSEARGRGADDNASGVGVLLEMATLLRNVESPYTLRFVAFGAEEAGLQGSRHFVSGMDAGAAANIRVMINLDSLTAGDIAYVYGSGGASGRVRDWVLDLAAREGLPIETQRGRNPEYPEGTTCDCSDHVPFDDAGIEYAYFESTNWALGEGDGYTQVDGQHGENGRIWHTNFDTLGYIESAFPGRIEGRLALFSRLVYRVLTEYEENPG